MTSCLVADLSAQAVINTILSKNFPNDDIVAEEDTKLNDRGLLDACLHWTRSVFGSDLQLDTVDQVQSHLRTILFGYDIYSVSFSCMMIKFIFRNDR
jgi:3'-phosphoadenosine 5'-phosphosulfate (PAPS) 3'-phosphatase